MSECMRNPLMMMTNICGFIFLILISGCNGLRTIQSGASEIVGEGSSRGGIDFLFSEYSDHQKTHSDSYENKRSLAGEYLDLFPPIQSNAFSDGGRLRSRRIANSTSSEVSQVQTDEVGAPLHVQVTGIHVDRSEFPLSKLLFKLTLRLALNEAAGRLQSEGPTAALAPPVFKQREQNRHQFQQAAGQHKQQQKLRRTVKISLSVRSANTCSRQYAGALAAEEYYVRRSRFFIVSGCDEAIRAVSQFASDWQVPIMTAAGFGADLNDKNVHKTLIRVAFSLRAAVEFLFKILKSFQWRRINLIVDESDANSQALRLSIEQYASKYASDVLQSPPRTVKRQPIQGDNRVILNSISFDLQSLLNGSASGLDIDEAEQGDATANATKVHETPQMDGTRVGDISDDKWPNEMTRTVIEDSLRQSSMFSRITILLIPQQFIRRFMLSVYDQKMANGLYTFINMPLLLTAGCESSDGQSGAQATSFGPNSPAAGTQGKSPLTNPSGGKQQQQQQSYTTSTCENIFIWRSLRPRARNAHAKQAFESLMSINLRTPTTKAYVYFASKLGELANTNYATTTTTTVAPPTGMYSNRIGGNGAPVNRKLQLDINPYSASFYDGVQIYATALNESLSIMLNELRDGNLATAQSDQMDNLTATIPAFNTTLSNSGGNRQVKSATQMERELHSRISELLRNRRFDNMVTGNIFINQNGDRETDYTLDDMNQMTGKFGPVIFYRGETRDIERLARIHWSSDASIGPTSDSIDCALVGTCFSKPISRFTFVLILLAAPLAVLFSGAFYYVHNKLSLESQLVDHWWKIHLSEIELVLTRRKNANDGSLVMTTASGSGEPGANIEGSLHSSSQGQSLSKLLEHNKNNRLAIGSSQPSGAGSVVGLGGISARQTQCDKTEVTKATDNSTGPWAASAVDACYGSITLGIYKLSKVALKPINKFHQSRKLMIELRSLKETNHNNLCRFVGILVDEGNLAIVNEFCPKGSLREFFHNESMVIDWTFKYSIINDIMAGLQYLHSSPLAFHGRLKSSNCLVSARFVVKLSDYGPHSLYEALDKEAVATAADKESEWLKSRLWVAPEHLKSSSRASGSMRGDVYSLGLLLYEIITNQLPLYDPEKDDYIMPLTELYHEIKNKGLSELMAPFVSAISEAAAVAANQTKTNEEELDIRPLVELMQSCWRYEPNKRPSSQAVSASLKRMTRGVTSKKLLENLTSRMEQYTNNLESLVEAKLATLVEEKFKTEELLYQFVPKSIASLLKEGQFVEPEAFDCVTVFYSDIVGFTSLSSQSSPMEVVDFLSDLYLCFDSTLEQHDIFKVDTIGDAYIVASGLPQRNDGKHVIEIACAALELRDRLKTFKIPHKPEHSLEMRVGIHSGPCIAGIVGGLNMPKYCVFGDTLTTGKFMESSGLPMKIHITNESRQLLQGLTNFSIEPRVPMITRDGLPYQTYWLEKGSN